MATNVIKSETYMLRFPAANVRTVSISERNGSVMVLFRRDGKDEVTVLTKKEAINKEQGKEKCSNNELKADAYIDGKSLILKSKYPKTLQEGCDGTIAYIVIAPRGKRVNVSTGKGDIWIGPGAASAQVKTDSGKVSVTGVNGIMDIVGHKGNVWIVNCPGPAHVSTDNGGVSIYNESLTNDMFVKTQGGNIKLEFGHPVGANVNVNTERGKIENEFTLTSLKYGTNHLHGKLHGGGPRLELASVNGEILVKEAPPSYELSYLVRAESVLEAYSEQNIFAEVPWKIWAGAGY